jgi:plasmid maintenance system antidote protein VapI
VPSVYRQKYAQAHATGKRVSELMRERNVSATALAASVPIQRSTLENYCAGRAIPSDLLASIAKKLQTTVAYLNSVTDDPRLPTAPVVS